MNLIININKKLMGISICSEERSTHKKLINTGKVINVNFRADTEDYDKKICVYESNTLREAIQIYQTQINKGNLKIKKAIYEPDSTELNLDTLLNELNINFSHTILVSFK